MQLILLLTLSLLFSACSQPHPPGKDDLTAQNLARDAYLRQWEKQRRAEEGKRTQDRAEANRVAHATYHRKATFRPEDYVPYQAQGTATLSGEAVVYTREGDDRYVAAESVMLIPATAYTVEIIEKDFIEAKKEIDPPLDQRLNAVIRTVQADSRGRFSFSNLPSGKYILYTTIYWEAPEYSRYGPYSSSIGGPMVKNVTIKDGEKQRVMLTK